MPSLKLPKVKLPKMNFKLNFWGRTSQLSRAWKKFLKQIPPSYRHFIQSYPRHFIVIGDQGSGKSQLVQKFIDQERDIYSFETSYTMDPDVQFYLGQRYILQEISWNMIEDRSIMAKKQLTNLWKRLYSYRTPTFVVTFDPLKWKNMDSEKINHYARLMLNKVALLSNLIDKPIEVRIALTHMDQVEGYSELNRILQLNGVSLDFDLSTYDTHTLQEAFKAYEVYLPLVMKNASADEYLKVLNFMKELSDFAFCIDQFVRSLTQKEYEKKILQLEKGYFVSHQESDLGSDIFDCVQEVTPSVYIKRHYLKHQVACASLAVAGVAYLGGYVAYKRHEVDDIRNKVALLEKYQRQEYLGEIVPYIQALNNFSSSKSFISRFQPIYYSSYNKQIDDFIAHSREYVLQPTFRKMVLNNQSEVELMYFLSLVKATNNNKLGQLINENITEWSELLDLPEDFIATYVNLAQTPQSSKVYVDEFNALYTKSAFSDHTPWFSFFNQMQHVLSAPHTLEAYLPDLRQQADALLGSIEKLDKYPLSAFLCKTLMEDSELKSHRHFLPRIRLIQDLRNNGEVLSELLTMVKGQSTEIKSFASQNVKDFLNSLDMLLTENEGDNRSFHFILGEKRWKFESQEWNNLLMEPKVKKIVEDYLVQNRDIGVRVFFKGSPELLDLDFTYLGEVFPAFKENASIPAHFTASAYERHVYCIAEELAKLNHSTLLSGEAKNDLSQFIAQNVDNYARQYRKHYEDVLAKLNAKPASFEEAEAIITFMTEPLSPYSHFLHAFINNLKVPASDSLLLYAMTNHLSELQFFNRLMPEELDKPGEMHTYQAILRNMLQESRGVSTTVVASRAGVLDKYLTPLGRMSLNILTEKSSSYQASVNEWLAEVEAPRKFESFFLNPVDWVHEFGLRDLEKSIGKAWDKECEPQLVKLFGKFPLNPNATESVTVEELEESLHPTSSLWAAADEIMGGVSVVRDEKWQPASNQLKLSDALYAKVNRFAHATNTLWDAEGNRQPLRFKVRTVPFSGKEDRGRKIIMSHLSTPKQTIFNLNQKPQSNTLEISWWEPEEILLGFELMESDTGVKPLRNHKQEATDWNIFQLLKQADRRDEHVWAWNIMDVENEKFALYFEENPWRVLNSSL